MGFQMFGSGRVTAWGPAQAFEEKSNGPLPVHVLWFHV